MAKLVVIVDLEVKEEDSDAFVAAARENARESVRLEPGCQQFDVIRALDDKTKITFYEVFDDAEAFQAHGAYPHATAFTDVAKTLVVKAAPRRGELVSE
jgi:quinol monooxygenase YgiN